MLTRYYQPPTVKYYGNVAKAMAAVQAQKPAMGETSGKVPCPACRGNLTFNIQASGLSRGHCGCGVRWCQ